MKQVKKIYWVVCFFIFKCYGAPENTSFNQQFIKELRMPKVRLVGYIKLDVFFDSRQIISERDGENLFYPAAPFYDAHCCDINKHGQFNMLPLETRLAAIITGPPIFNADTNAYIEGDFYGTSDDAMRAYRMRHAYINFNWEKRSLLLGDFWHPLFIVDCYPQTVSYNTGSPIDTYSRNTQIRFTEHFGWGELILALLAQRHGASNTGVDGLSTEYVRNSMIPMCDVQLRLFLRRHIFGVGLDYKRLVPRLFSTVESEGCDRIFKTKESLNSIIAATYMTLNFEALRTEAKIIYSQNGTDQSLIGGYAVATRNPITGHQTYANVRTLSAWVDVGMVDTAVQPGVFIGVSKNLGAGRRLFIDPSAGINFPIEYVEAANINYVFRTSPRLTWNNAPVRFAAELEWTRAAYGGFDLPEGSCINDCPRGAINRCGQVINSVPVDNVRFLLAAYYFF